MLKKTNEKNNEINTVNNAMVIMLFSRTKHAKTVINDYNVVINYINHIYFSIK